MRVMSTCAADSTAFRMRISSVRSASARRNIELSTKMNYYYYYFGFSTGSEHINFDVPSALPPLAQNIKHISFDMPTSLPLMGPGSEHLKFDMPLVLPLLGPRGEHINFDMPSLLP